MKRIRKRHFYTAAIVFILFVLVGKFYQMKQIEKIESVLQANAIFVSEPLWDFDIDAMADYFKLVSEANNYSYLSIVDEQGEPVLELDNSKILTNNTAFLRSGLLAELQFEEDILYDGEKIGQIVVTWLDNSVYFYCYTFFIALLLYIIILLYMGKTDAKLSLEEQYHNAKKQKEYIEELFNIVPEGLITLDSQNREIEVNSSFNAMVEEWAIKRDLFFSEAKVEFLDELLKQSIKSNNGQYYLSIGSQSIVIEYTTINFESSDDNSKLISIRDITHLKSLERQLSQAQKMEAVGRLASGIAHEINTPTQYVISNINFIDEAIEDIAEILESAKKFTELELDAKAKEMQMEVEEHFANADWEFLKEEMPGAIAQAKEGLQRISKIVSAMKSFSHPSGEMLERQDINKAIETTVSVARNEWKYFAEVQFNLDQSLSKIPCFLDELNQVFLIIIVNSAQAIIEKYGEADPVKGEISISTRIDEGQLIIAFRDNGAGISAEHKAKIFDPFFTTKDVDKGTGQGLAIAHDIIVKKHKGKIEVESTVGQGTEFRLLIPVNLHEEKSNEVELEKDQS